MAEELTGTGLKPASCGCCSLSAASSGRKPGQACPAHAVAQKALRLVGHVAWISCSSTQSRTAAMSRICRAGHRHRHQHRTQALRSSASLQVRWRSWQQRTCVRRPAWPALGPAGQAEPPSRVRTFPHVEGNYATYVFTESAPWLHTSARAQECAPEPLAVGAVSVPTAVSARLQAALQQARARVPSLQQHDCLVQAGPVSRPAPHSLQGAAGLPSTAAARQRMQGCRPAAARG